MNILSVNFCVIFAAFFTLYWLIKDKRIQNLLLLAFSYIFYALIGWKFLGLLILTSLSVYGAGLLLGSEKLLLGKKAILILTIILNIGILFVFKYYDFFVSEIARVLTLNAESLLLHLILPVGISFYTFTAIGYAIDVYRGQVNATKEIVPFLTFLSFFPLILSGPIERSKGLLPQLKQKRDFDYPLVTDGIVQIVWGAFKKIVLADNCAVIVNNAFGNYENLLASSLAIGAVLYSIQIYCDFSGYSDIAIGLSKMLGFRVRRNFRYPYFSLHVSDFWRRWHMSLQSWFTDYIYFPLGGSRCSKQRSIFNTFVVFTVCGIWHGANWTFIVWGVYHAILFIPLILFGSKEFRRSTVNEVSLLPTFKEVGLILTTFLFITLGWILFRAPSLSVGIGYIGDIFSTSIFATPSGIGLNNFAYIGALLVVFFIVEWLQRSKEYPLILKVPGWIKVIILYVLVYHIIFHDAAQSDFIYFQF